VIKFKTIPMPSVFVLEAELPRDVIESTNKYLDDLLQQDDRKTAADTLVGQIQKGEQLRIDSEDDELINLSATLRSIAAKYISEFFTQTGQQLLTDRSVQIEELWSVHSYEGDYNPIHDHGTETIMGVSCTTWTKVPEQIKNLPSPLENTFKYNNASGCCDGFLEFVYGQNSVLDKERLKPTQAMILKPEVGKIYFFPSWLQHMVYPFKGDGERRTVAANFNCYPVGYEENN